jgi:hypothetical protein
LISSTVPSAACKFDALGLGFDDGAQPVFVFLQSVQNTLVRGFLLIHPALGFPQAEQQHAQQRQGGRERTAEDHQREQKHVASQVHSARISLSIVQRDSNKRLYRVNQGQPATA